MKSLIISIGIALSAVTAPPPDFSATIPLPEVHCLVVTDGDGYAQVDCVGPVLREPYEAYVPVTQVNRVLAVVGEEWTYDVRWEVR